ncbi:CAP domain-containing protein [Streptomyces sp. NPDC015032]|uniref:CAP domain-containing protein n=1 Tax=Streptomyces sp. NPDC015032 TaxID=3364937 RepID=UPI0036FF24DA
MRKHRGMAPRRRMTIAVAALGAVGTMGFAEAAEAAHVPSAATAAAFSLHEKKAARLLELVNSVRRGAGCPPLTANKRLTKAARKHSTDMASHRNMSHTGSDGSTPGERITDARYDRTAYGENIARGYTTPESVMAGWMSSPGHRRNILDCSFKEIGVGLAQPGNYWTQDFGRPDRRPAR